MFCGGKTKSSSSSVYFTSWYFICFLLFLQKIYIGNHIFNENGSETGQMFFNDIENIYYLKLTLEDLLGLSHAGLLDKATVAIEKVLPSTCLQLWLDLLGASRKWLNVELQRWAFE